MHDDQTAAQRLKSIGSGPSGGSSSGPGGRIDDVTAPDDNLAGLMRNRVTIIGEAVKPIGSVHVPSEEPRLLSRVVGVLPGDIKAEDQEEVEGSS